MPRRRPSRALIAVLLSSFAGLVPVTTAAPTRAQQAETADFVPIGTLDRFPEDARRVLGDEIIRPGWDGPPESSSRIAAAWSPDGLLLAVPEARQLWQVFESHKEYRTLVAVRDLDSLAIIGSFSVPGSLERGGASSGGGDWVSAIDGAKRVFLVSQAKSVFEIETRTWRVKEHAFPPGVEGAVAGLGYDPYGNRVILTYSVFGSISAANATTLMAAIDLATSQPSGPRALKACNAPLPGTENSNTYQTGAYVADERYVYQPCQRAGNSTAVVRLDRRTLMDSTSSEEVAVGPTNLETVMVDPKAGRIMMATTLAVMWVFDTASMAFVGVVGTTTEGGSPRVGYGIDPATGRVYFLSPTFGLGTIEARYFPVPQAKADPRFASPGQELIISDAATNRVFVLAGFATDKLFTHTIYRTTPAPAPPPPLDPDRNTVDQPEAAGRTEARYNAAAGGYGARVLLANGISTIAPAPALGDLAPTAMLLTENVNAKCGFFDRELVAARVSRTEADTGSTVAEATAVHIDPRTRLDLDKPSRCEPYAKNGQDYLENVFATAPEPYDNNDERNPRWNRDAAVCSTSVDDDPASSAGDDHGAAPLGSSRAECPTPGKGDVRATADAQLTGPVAVGRAHAETRLSRGAGRVRARSESIASDISLGDNIAIGEIRAVATSDATGRPRSGPMSTHTVTIRDVRVNGTELCGVCDPATTVDTLNRLLTGRAAFRLGTDAADKRLLAGSPGGALTAVQKSIERQVSDRSLVGDFTNEVPALELVVYNDNGTWGRGRQLYQFAAVGTSATYNIVALPQFSDSGSDPGGADDDGEVTGSVGDAEVGGSEGAFASVVGTEDDDGLLAGVARTVGRAVLAVARGLRVFATDPRHGLAILTGWGLLVLPALLYRRRTTVVVAD